MRVVWALLAIGIVGFQTPSGPNELALVIDVDSPVANAERATRLREQALADINGPAHPVYFELTAQSIRAVPETSSDSFRKIPFSFVPPTFSGVSLTFAEASEILRKNEAVRDTVIRRVCRTSNARECGGMVHGAATMLVAETETASARKVRHLVEAATSTRARTLVLVTAGWPYRDAGRLNLDKAVRELRGTGITLVVWKLPPLVPYKGLVKNATETLAARLSSNVVSLTDERDVERARGTVAYFYNNTAAPSMPVDDRGLERHEPTPALKAFDPGDAVLRRATSYVAQFTRVFSAVIWHERYEQEHRIRRRFNASGTSFSVVAGRRQLDSELLLVWLPRDASWIAVRDVIAIDGTARPAGDRRLRAVFEQPTVSADDLWQLATENGRFNIGQIVRTFNEPTLALLFLNEHYVGRFAYARTGEQMVSGRRTTTYNFVEHARPTVIQDHDRDVPARGTLWIDPVTGHVLQTSLELSAPNGQLRGRMTVRYGPNPKLDVLVPEEMRETYTSLSGEQVTGLAVYTDFRRFETAGRLIVPK
jgi:hypothetical protein